jgi:hypothetical protein
MFLTLNDVKLQFRIGSPLDDDQTLKGIFFLIQAGLKAAW